MVIMCTILIFEGNKQGGRIERFGNHDYIGLAFKITTFPPFVTTENQQITVGDVSKWQTIRIFASLYKYESDTDRA